MKKTDIAMLVLIAGISILVSALTLKSILGDPSEKTRNVQITNEISDSFTEPSKDIFNKEAINPTVQVFIGDGSDKKSSSSDDDKKSDDSENKDDKNNE